MNRNLNDDEILEEVEKGSSNIDNNKLDLIVKGEEEIKVVIEKNERYVL